MNAEAIFPAAPTADAPPPFVIRWPHGADSSAARELTPLIFASPHSGRLYPADMMQASLLDGAAIRRSEDAFVDSLIEGGADHGATIISATHARAYVDVNRAPYELDPAMFTDPLPDFVEPHTARVAAGLGSIARIVADGHEIYARKLTFAEAQARIETVHYPYHDALRDLMRKALARHGAVLLVDWHSMPAAAARPLSQGGCDVVLGDRFGAACAGRVTDAAESALSALGYRVARNIPYAGGYTTEVYGRPKDRVHALQIEINRGLYLDEPKMTPNGGYLRLKGDLEAVFARLATVAAAL